jgi:hypothetical protein
MISNVKKSPSSKKAPSRSRTGIIDNVTLECY